MTFATAWNSSGRPWATHGRLPLSLHIHHQLADHEHLVGAAGGIGQGLGKGLAQGLGEAVGEFVGHGRSSKPAVSAPRLANFCRRSAGPREGHADEGLEALDQGLVLEVGILDGFQVGLGAEDAEGPGGQPGAQVLVEDLHHLC